eukprot:CAMPEP_0198560424 /NCGR_PEP_ID=MMETSP1462-20131121/93930_1 /TAXON_ID=1333877 /ORGANISM="Brandtodinium nutriculum, Strain RCC3387" /LENGTH=76 /DNA_ID=CAMNT_0044291291 /DNA_START=221 /DNA_END=451 /DNA_ORIENTATION=+
MPKDYIQDFLLKLWAYHDLTCLQRLASLTKRCHNPRCHLASDEHLSRAQLVDAQVRTCTALLLSFAAGSQLLALKQ